MQETVVNLEDIFLICLCFLKQLLFKVSDYEICKQVTQGGSNQRGVGKTHNSAAHATVRANTEFGGSELLMTRNINKSQEKCIDLLFPNCV